MSAQPATHAWFAPSPVDAGLAQNDDLLKPPGEFERLWRGFMTARVTLGLVLVLLQGSLWALGQSTNTGLIYVCGGYFAATLAVRLFAQPRRLGRTPDPQWMFTIGVDVVVFTLLQFLQGSNINYAPLLAFPVLLASVLGTLWLAVGTAASVSLLLLGYSAWLSNQGGVDSAAHFAQSALTGAGCFVLALLANQLSTRLVLEEQRAKRSQLAMRLQQQVNALVIETLTDGILVVDDQGIVRAANPAARHMLGTNQSRRDALFGLSAESAWSALAELAHLSFSRTEKRHTDVVVHHPGQGLRRLRVRTRQTGAQGAERPGDESLCVMFLQDQREMEARMRTEKLASMGRMSAAVAHEIRNPLAAIVQANALLEEDMDDPKQRQLTQMVAQNAQRLGRIVDDVLDISRVQAQNNAVSAQSLLLCGSVERIWQDCRSKPAASTWQPWHRCRQTCRSRLTRTTCAACWSTCWTMHCATPAARAGRSRSTSPAMKTGRRCWPSGATACRWNPRWSSICLSRFFHPRAAPADSACTSAGNSARGMAR